ncbi:MULTISPECIES: AAA family ATPase [Streptomyces]|uniref:AAA family ATPase n=2 Tax=Streptomyces TaxID=1883 RepID=A0ABD5J6G5_9ACTN|nr:MULTISPECIES: AAA family ATPase [Streptomyces]MEE4582884.1 AAA family ATPase [Streptomyces sp. DSM 41602]QTI90062.1 ATP-binding protein [Streptomyces sp. AgN23]RSS49587.1 ATP-binding protein [Streptomyces sp. WAC05858]WJD95207.1 AAA family ATPase [Streptomyces antimycoticus]WTA86012.1 ATP-binding protein [Streptomyces antimycoticus]
MPAPDPASPAPGTPPAFVAIGPAGSGKSHVARELARRLRAAYLDKDSLAGDLVDAALELVGRRAGGREDDPTYVERLMPAEYKALFATAADNLRLGLPVVLDAPFAAYLADPDFLTASADQTSWPTGTPVVVVEVRTSPETVRTRLTERGLPRDRAKLADWPAFWRQLGGRECAWSGARHIVVNNDGEPDLDAVVALTRDQQLSTFS